jgi:hypothetical protein
VVRQAGGEAEERASVDDSLAQKALDWARSINKYNHKGTRWYPPAELLVLLVIGGFTK